jgi:threonine dehydrogenase-like Zn-dependent dehydrogenase
MIKTRQAVLTGPGNVTIVRTELSEPAHGQVLIRVTQCGLCSGEVDQWRGAVEPYLGGIGHEVAGIVERVGSGVDTLNVGDHVVAWVPGGGFAEWMVIWAADALVVRPNISFPAVAEPLSCCVNSVELTQPALGDDVVIVGTGYMSHLIQALSILRGARSITVIGRRDEPLRRAMDLGATRVVDVSSESVIAAIEHATDGRLADVVYEVTGAAEPLAHAEMLVRQGGKLAIVGYHQGKPRAMRLGHLNFNAITLVNCHFRDKRQIMWGMARGMRLVESGRLDLTPLMTHIYPLDDIGQAFIDAAERPKGFVKAVVAPIVDG